MKARFEGILRLDFLDESVDGKWFETVFSFKYFTNEAYPLLAGFCIVPKGTKTDFASVPRGFRWLISRVGKYGKAAVLHDYLCGLEGFPRKEADQIFLEAMKALGVGWFKRRTMYFGVRSYSILTFKK